MLARARYLNRVAAAYLGSGPSQLTFWHEPPEANPHAWDEPLGDYYQCFFTKADYDAHTDDAGVPMLDYRGHVGLQYNPIAIAQWGLGNWNLERRTGDRSRRERWRLAADWLVENLKPNANGIPVWRHEFDWEYRDTLKKGWYSALSQGQGISLLVRAQRASGDGDYLDAAHTAFRSMVTEVDAGGVRIVEGVEGAWLEEAIVNPPTHILNGFLWAIWGVRDYAIATDSPEARDLLAACSRPWCATSRASTAASGRSTSSRAPGCRCWRVLSITSSTSISSPSLRGCSTSRSSPAGLHAGEPTPRAHGAVGAHSPRRRSSRRSTTDMHVLLIHQVFAGPDDPGGTRHYEIGCRLVESGHRFTVITSAVNYLTGETVQAPVTAWPAGMEVIRIGGREDIHRSYVSRARAFFGFAQGALRAARSVPDVDVVWGTSPPLVQLVPAWLASRRCGGRFLFEERDLWPEFAVGMGVVRDGVLSRSALRLKRFLYGRARRVVVNSPGFLPFLRDYGVPDAKIRVVPNGVDVDQFEPSERGAALRRDWGASDRFVVVYAGALGPANGLEVVLAAAERLRDTRALFVLVGDGKARADLHAAAEARGLDNVRFVRAQPKRAMRDVLGAADACLATLRDIPLFRTTYPNKVFDYMAAGRPVLLGIDGVIREVVDRAGAGIFVPPADAEALVAGVRRLLADPDEARAMGMRGRAAVCAGFARRKQAADFECVLHELVDGEAAAPAAARKVAVA